MDEARIPKVVLIVIVTILVVGGVVGAYLGLSETSNPYTDKVLNDDDTRT